MSLFEEIAQLPEDFRGVVRLFPLPSLVMFPHVLQPLHIFEPRYRELLEEALASDQLITMALLQPGWEEQYDGTPPITPIVCIGRIINHVRLPDGNYNLLLFGLRRAKLVRELPLTRSFRRAEVQLLDEIPPSLDLGTTAILRQRLLASFRESVPKSSLVQQQVEQLLSQEIPLGVLTDMVAHTMNFPLEVKLRLLHELHVGRRAEILVELIDHAREQASDATEIRRPYPPPFSAN